MPGTGLKRRAFVQTAVGASALATVSAQVPIKSPKPRFAFIGLMNGHCWRVLQNVTGVKIEPNQRLGGPATQLEWGDFSAVEFVGVAESEPALVETARTYQPDLDYMEDYRELVEVKKPHVVWSFVETNRHLEIVEYLAPRGIHVIFEKPLATTFADAKKIQALASEHRIHVMTNYQMAWWPTNHELKKQADSGSIGRIWRLHGIVGHGGPRQPTSPRARIAFDWITDPIRNGGGALMDFGCYNVLWALWFMGRPRSVYARIHNLRRELYAVESNSTMVLDYEDGVAILEGSWDLPHNFQELRVSSRQGSMYMTRAMVEVRHGLRGEAQAVRPAPLAKARSNPITYVLDRINRGVRDDNITSLDLNVEVIEVLEAAKASIRTGRSVSL